MRLVLSCRLVLGCRSSNVERGLKDWLRKNRRLRVSERIRRIHSATIGSRRLHTRGSLQEESTSENATCSTPESSGIIKLKGSHKLAPHFYGPYKIL